MSVKDQLKEIADIFDKKESVLFDCQHKGTIDQKQFDIEINTLCEWYVNEYRRLKEEQCCEKRV